MNQEYVRTPRFGTVRIECTFPNLREARKAGYTEPTHYYENGYTVMGWFYEENHAKFALVKEN